MSRGVVKMLSVTILSVLVSVMRMSRFRGILGRFMVSGSTEWTRARTETRRLRERWGPVMEDREERVRGVEMWERGWGVVEARRDQGDGVLLRI